MILTRVSLRKMSEGALMRLNRAQEDAILEIFSQEPNDGMDEWSEQDIWETIRYMMMHWDGERFKLPGPVNNRSEDIDYLNGEPF